MKLKLLSVGELELNRDDACAWHHRTDDGPVLRYALKLVDGRKRIVKRLKVRFSPDQNVRRASALEIDSPL